MEVYPTSRIQNLTIGRDPSSDVRFHADQDVFVSRHHAIIEWKPAQGVLTRFTLIDLLSSNGTYLNGELLSAEGCELKSGDRIQFGRGGPDVLLEIDELPDIASEPAQARPSVSQTQEMPAITGLAHRTIKDP